MTAYALIIPGGTDWTATWGVTDSAGAPLTVNGWTARAQIREIDAGLLLADLAPTAAGTAVTVTLLAATTAAWTFTTGVYDVQLIDPSGHVTRIASGQVFVSPEVTHV